MRRALATLTAMLLLVAASAEAQTIPTFTAKGIRLHSQAASGCPATSCVEGQIAGQGDGTLCRCTSGGAWVDVASVAVAGSGAVLESDFDAQTILAATADNTPVAVTVGESEIVGRIAAGNVGALTAANVRTIINVEDGADVTDATNVDAAGAVMQTDFGAAGDVIVGTGAGTSAAVTVTANTVLGDDGTGVEALDATELLALIGVEAGADVTDATNVDAAGAVMATDFDAQTILAATTDDTPAAVTVGEGELVGRATGGNVGALTASQGRTLLNIASAAVYMPATNSVDGTLDTVTSAAAAYDATNRGFYRRFTGGGDNKTGQNVYLWRVPPDFAGWSTTALSFGHLWSDATGNNAATIKVYDTAGVEVLSQALAASGTYATASALAASFGAGTYTPDGVVTVRLDLVTDTGDTVDQYDLRLFYSRN